MDYSSTVPSNTCFRKAGVLNAGLDVINLRIEDDSDPFLAADVCMELQGLIEYTGGEGCIYYRLVFDW